MAKKMFSRAYFFDLSHAFDLVRHDVLLRKLERLGIRGNPLEWVGSYLSARLQFVEIKWDCENVMPEYSGVNVGVPQGSVLGPILFLLYINDFTDFVEQGDKIMFVDDLTVLLFSESWAELNKRETKLVEEMKVWCKANNLIENADKRKILTFRTNDRMYLNKTINDDLDHAKLLGLQLDKNLKWQAHAEDTIPKLKKRALFAIKRIANVCGVEEAKFVYYALSNSIISYRILLWGRSLGAQRVFKLQKWLFGTLKINL